MKRLFVRPCFRRRGLGRRLARRIIRSARDIGYSAIRLNIVPSAMPAATALCEALGFEPIGANPFNPVPGAAHYELNLQGLDPSSPESDDLCLRPCEPSDVTAVHQLIHHAIDACYPAAYAPEAVSFFKQYHSLEAVAQRASTTYGVIAERGERIVATGSIHDENISAVFVSSQFQRMGIGATIMACLENRARAAGVRTLALDASLPSVRFYSRLGYAVTEQASLPLADDKTLSFYRMHKSLS